MKSQTINYIRADYPGLDLTAPEERRAEAHLKHIGEDFQHGLAFWI